MKEISETEKEKLIQALNNIKIEYCFNDNPLYHDVLSLYEVIKMAQQAALSKKEIYTDFNMCFGYDGVYYHINLSDKHWSRESLNAFINLFINYDPLFPCGIHSIRDMGPDSNLEFVLKEHLGELLITDEMYDEAQKSHPDDYTNSLLKIEIANEKEDQKKEKTNDVFAINMNNLISW